LWLPKVKVLRKNLVLVVLLRMVLVLVLVLVLVVRVRVNGKMGRVKLLLKLEGKMVFRG
jgi:hypothetical protein